MSHRIYRGFLTWLFISCVLTISISCASSQTQKPTEFNTSKWSRLAIKGYDPVAYFTMGKPQIGLKEYELKWREAKWRFASEQHMTRFRNDPEKYSPQYGGYCAYAISQGDTAGIDPEAWAIVDGKLYLNYDASIQKKWEQDRPAYIALADALWPKIRDKLLK